MRSPFSADPPPLLNQSVRIGVAWSWPNETKGRAARWRGKGGALKGAGHATLSRITTHHAWSALDVDDGRADGDQLSQCDLCS